MKTKKNDLIEIEFVARLEDGTVFDTTSKEEAIKAKLIDEKTDKKFEPLKIFIGKGHVIKGLDKALEDKEVGKDYEIKLSAKEAYGLRDPTLIKTLPTHAFEQVPVRGMFVNVNGLVARVSAVTGGRVLVDFNNPLSGKEIKYNFKIVKLVEDEKEELKTLFEMFKINIDVEEIEGKFKVHVKDNVPEEILKKVEKEVKELIKKEVVLEKVK